MGSISTRSTACASASRALPISAATTSDYHGTQEAIPPSKLILFRNLVKPDGVAVVAVDHTFAAEVKDAARGRSLRIIEVDGRPGISGSSRLAVAGFSQVLTLGYGGVKYQVQLPLVGAFQVENALVAAGQRSRPAAMLRPSLPRLRDWSAPRGGSSWSAANPARDLCRLCAQARRACQGA